MKHAPAVPTKSLPLFLLILVFIVPFLSSCSESNSVQEKESKQRLERKTPFNEEVDAVRVLQERMP